MNEEYKIPGWLWFAFGMLVSFMICAGVWTMVEIGKNL